MTRLGLKDKAIVLSKLNAAVPADVATLFEQKKTAIAAGTLIPFAGPLKDNKGQLKVPAGKAMTDEELTAFNWYVEGVASSLSK